MSTLKVDTILKRTGTGTITLGQSGDTITIPSGATLNAAGSTSGSIGKILQVQSSMAQSRTTGSGTTYADAGFSDTITCSSTSSKVLVIANFNWGVDNNNQSVTSASLKQRLLRSNDGFSSDSNQIYATTAYSVFPEDSGMDFMIAGTTAMVIVDSPSSISELTYKVQVKSNFNTGDLWEVGTDIGDSEFGARGYTLMEIGA